MGGGVESASGAQKRQHKKLERTLKTVNGFRFDCEIEGGDRIGAICGSQYEPDRISPILQRREIETGAVEGVTLASGCGFLPRQRQRL
jgi:hypothetical protein